MWHLILKFHCDFKQRNFPTISFVSVNDIEELPTLEQRKKQVQVPIILETSHKSKDKVVVDATHDLFFPDDTFDLVCLDQLTLVDSL